MSIEAEIHECEQEIRYLNKAMQASHRYYNHIMAQKYFKRRNEFQDRLNELKKLKRSDA